MSAMPHTLGLEADSLHTDFETDFISSRSSTMTQFNQPIRRTGGDLDVYTGLLLVATLVLVVGVALMATRNIDHSSKGQAGSGGMIKLIEGR